MSKNEFNGMSGAYAAMFTPYDTKGRVNAEMIARIMGYGYANGLNGFYRAYAKHFAALGIAKRNQVLKTGGRIK